MPDPVPISKNDCGCPALRNCTNCSRQNAVVGCWPVPKLKPGSNVTTAWPRRARRLLQVGLMSNDCPNSRTLKYFLHEVLQSACRTLVMEMRPGPTSKSQPERKAKPAR